MEQLQEILKSHWEKVLLGAAGVLFLYTLIWPFLFPSETAQKSQEIVNDLNTAVDRILKSKPPQEEIPPYSEWLTKPYKEIPKDQKLAKWAFFRRPFIWKEKHTGPQKVKQTPQLYPPTDLSATLSEKGVRLSWKHSDQNQYCQITKTEIYRRGGGQEEFERIAIVEGEEEEYSDINVGPKTTYTYYLKVYARAEESEDVNPFPPGKDVVQSDTVTIKTPPEVIVDINDYQLGEMYLNLIPDKKAKGPKKWRKPPIGFKMPDGTPLRAVQWNNSKKGQKNWARFVIWRLNRTSGGFEEFIQPFEMQVFEGDPILFVKRDWQEGKAKVTIIDSGYKMVSLGQGHDLKGGKVPVAVLEAKSINETFLDMTLTPFNFDGEDEPYLITLAKGEGLKEKERAESSGSQIDKEQDTSPESGGKDEGGPSEEEEDTPF